MTSWLDALEVLSQRLDHGEQRLHAAFHRAPAVDLRMPWPGVGFLLAVVMAGERGDVRRCEGPDPLASYAGTTPRVHASGGKTRYGPLRPDVNRYLKWAFVEAANASCRVRRGHPPRHGRRLDERLSPPQGPQTAMGAVARHVAEAADWLLSTGAPYREPHGTRNLGSSTEAYARAGELSALTREVMSATRLRNPFMPHDGEEMLLARPERSLRGKSPTFSLARRFQRCSP